MNIISKNIIERSTTVTLPVKASPTHIHEYKIPQGMNRLIAVGLYVDDTVKLPSLTTIGMGVNSDTEAVYPTSYKNFLDGQYGEYKNRFKSVNVDASADILKIFITPNETLRQEYRMVFHFIFEDRNQCE